MYFLTGHYAWYALEPTPIFEMAKKEKIDGPLLTVFSGTRCHFLCNCEIVIYDLNGFENSVEILFSWQKKNTKKNRNAMVCKKL